MDTLAIVLAAALCVALVGPALYASWRSAPSVPDRADSLDDAISPQTADFEDIMARLLDPSPLPRESSPERSERRFAPRAADRHPSATER